MKMWSEFIFLVFIIYKAEAKLPEDVFSVIHLSYNSSRNNESYTVWKNKPLKIFIGNANVRYVWCYRFFPNNETGRYLQFVPATSLTPDSYSIVNITKVTDEMNTMWKCTVLTNDTEWGNTYEYKGQNYSVKDFRFQVHIKAAEAPQTMLVNNMVVPTVVEYYTEDVDFTAEYHYVDGDIVNVTCVNLLNEDNATLTMEYDMAGTTSDKSTVKDIISSSKMIGFVTKLHAGHNNSYMICTNTGPKDYTKVMIRFVMLTEPNVISISINGMTLRPILDSFTIRHYESKYKLVSHQTMHVTCEVERTDVKLLMLDDDFDKTVRRKTELIPNKKTELSFYLNPGGITTLACSADNLMGGLAESVYIEFTTAIFPTDHYSSVHMELPASGTVMELYSYKDYKLSVILYELKYDETLHLTCGPLRLRRELLLYLQLNNTEPCKSYGCNVSTTLQSVNWDVVYRPIICFLKEEQDLELPSSRWKDIVWKEIRVILLERALAVTVPSSTTLSTTLTADNTTAEPPPSGTSIHSINNNRPAYFLIALGIAIVIIILVKKQCFVRLCLTIPAPRLDPASVFYVNLLSVCRPINEREAAALPENIYEEIPLGDLSNINSNRNKSDNQNDPLPNGETHHNTEIDYAQCKPKGTEAPHKNNYIYNEPYDHINISID